jgi:RHS repeat-associated protein
MGGLLGGNHLTDYQVPLLHPEGNEVEKSKGAGLETWYYGYDTKDRLVSVRQTSDGSTNLLLVTYTYDVLGNRAEQDEGASGTGTVTTRFAYDGTDVWADLSGGNALLVRYLRGDQADQIFARTVSTGQPNAGVAWYLTDRLGSVRDLMDSTATIRDHLDYDGYGNVTETNSGFGDRYKYTAREYDSATELQYNRTRYYDPKAGRWLNQDPNSFLAGDSNLYRYVDNSPTNNIDPQGTLTWKVNDVTLKPGTGGGFEWAARFIPQEQLNKEEKRGFIILEIYQWYVAVNSKNKIVLRSAGFPDMFATGDGPVKVNHYWELFEVELHLPGHGAGSVRGTKPRHVKGDPADSDVFRFDGAGGDTKGALYESAVVYWDDGSKTGEWGPTEGWGWWNQQHVPPGVEPKLNLVHGEPGPSPQNMHATGLRRTIGVGWDECKADPLNAEGFASFATTQGFRSRIIGEKNLGGGGGPGAPPGGPAPPNAGAPGLAPGRSSEPG